MQKSTVLKAGGFIVAACSTIAGLALPSTEWLTPEISRWAFLIAIIGIVIGGAMWFSGRKAQTASLSKRRILVTLAIIVVLIAIITTVGVLNLRQPQESILTPQPSQDWQWSHPSPREIMENIDALLPYLQESARQKYEGLLVKWGVKLVSVSEKTSGTYIQTYSLEEHQELVAFTIDISEYPQLTIMEEGQEFVVQGIIANVDTISIELDDCRLIFD